MRTQTRIIHEFAISDDERLLLQDAGRLLQNMAQCGSAEEFNNLAADIAPESAGKAVVGDLITEELVPFDEGVKQIGELLTIMSNVLAVENAE